MDIGKLALKLLVVGTLATAAQGCFMPLQHLFAPYTPKEVKHCAKPLLSTDINPYTRNMDPKCYSFFERERSAIRSYEISRERALRKQ